MTIGSVGGAGDGPEVRLEAGLRRPVVVRRHDAAAPSTPVSAARCDELDRVAGVVGAGAGEQRHVDGGRARPATARPSRRRTASAPRRWCRRGPGRRCPGRPASGPGRRRPSRSRLPSSWNGVTMAVRTLPKRAVPMSTALLSGWVGGTMRRSRCDGGSPDGPHGGSAVGRVLRRRRRARARRCGRGRASSAGPRAARTRRCGSWADDGLVNQSPSPASTRSTACRRRGP